MKKHKSQTPDQASVSNGTAEVFILPPDLLAKLGISIGNIQNSEVVSPSTSLIKDTVQSVEHSITNCLPENGDASSIIQTANLMKESVFLSPTFFQTAPSVPDNEELIVDDTVDNRNTTNSSECSKEPQLCNRSCVTLTKISSTGEQNVSQLLNDKPKPEVHANEVKDLENYESVKEYQVENNGGGLILTDIPPQNTDNGNVSNGKLTDEHADEAYLSDCSNSYSGCSPGSINSELNKKEINKSNDISETDFIDPSQLKCIGVDVICSTSVARFTPVNTNSGVELRRDYNDLVVSDKISPVFPTIQNIVDEPSLQKLSSETTTNQKGFVADESLNDIKKSVDLRVVAGSDCMADITDKNYSEKSSQENTELKLIANKQSSNELQGKTECIPVPELNFRGFATNDNDSKECENTDNDMSNNNRIVKTKNKEKTKSATENIIDTQEKVKEIAAYLSKIANERKNIHKINNKHIEKVAKCDPITSKLCIQGVEKPGGKIIKKDIIQKNKMFVSVSKTYQRANIQKVIPKVVDISDAMISTDLFQITDQDKPSGKVRGCTHPFESCICYDFGNLAYYDCEMLYEHIHFWAHKNIQCDPQTLYSIYNEDYTVLKQSVKFIEDAHQDEDDTNTRIQGSLCWNEINVPIYDEKCELSTNKSIVPVKIGSSNEQQSINNAVSEKAAKSKAKTPELKNIKCGICNETVFEKEWEVHKEKYHNSVAWEANQKLDLTNKSFLKTSKRMLKELGFLKCPICETNFKEMSKYIRHLNKCTKQKMNPSTAAEPSTSAKSSKQLTKISINSESNLNTVESNNDTQSSKRASISEVTTKLSVKSVIDKSSNPTKKSTMSENVLTPSITSDQTTLTLKKVTNNLEVECMEPSRSTRKSSLNSVSKTDNLHTSSTKIDTYKKEQIVNTDVSNRTSNDISRNTRKNTKGKNESLESRKSTESNKLSKALKTEESNNLSQEFSGNDNSTKVCKSTVTKTYMKSLRNASDSASKNVSNSTKNSNDNNTGTTKSIKRSADTAKDPLAKKIKITESSLIIEKPGNDVSKKHPTEDKTGQSSHKTDEKKSTFSQQCALPIPTIAPNLPNKVEIMDSEVIEISIENPYMPLENPTEPINMPLNECLIPSDSFAQAMDNSTLSSDIAMNDSRSTEYYMVLAPLPESDDFIQCGLCQKRVQESEWIKHISAEHDYIAWRDGESPLDLDDEIGVKKHLQGIANRNGGLECSKCGVVRKFAKKFLDHIKSCNGVRMDNVSSLDLEDENVPLLNYKESKKSRGKASVPSFTCGVCNDTVDQSSWIEHIRVVHKYLAWTSEEQPLDLNNAAEVKQHLKNISKKYDGLLCNTCGGRWNYPKKYLTHVEECEYNVATKKSHIGAVGKHFQNDRKPIELELPSVVTCGICKLDVEGRSWIKHIQVAHEYMAWIEGEDPLDPENPEQVKEHLNRIVRAAGELVCTKCGEARRFSHAYLQHVTACAKTGFQIEIDQKFEYNKDEYICGVCHEKGKLSEWHSHAMSMHYNIAWKIGDIPINLKNPYAVEKYLKVYRKKQEMTCRVCKETRSSCVGFYAHILTCGKSEKEIEAVQDLCEICNNKYLCIYRNQHMAAHRDSDRRRERREMLAKKAEEEALNPPKPLEPGSKRRAAERAKQGIQKYASNTFDGKPACGCGDTFKDAQEFEEHSCPHKQTGDNDSSDVSVKMENESEESADEIVDSGLSDDEDDRLDKKKKRVRVGEGSTKVQRMPYRVNNYIAYLSEAYRDFVRKHYTSQSLFNEWRDSEYTIVPVEETANYLPQLTESCKVRFSDKDTGEWTTFKRFEAKKIKGYSIFTGGATQCIAWAPPNLEEESLSCFLAVSPHRGPDVPRYASTDRPQHPASLQIWDFGQFDMMPRCALCIAHEYGIVWAMDWCPSGARDASPASQAVTEETAGNLRLGLLAIACSNGSAYILAVPTPPPQNDQNEPMMYKLKPVAELRLSMTSERIVYQATSIKWSQQKSHSTIIVGYSDGMTALYDVNTESPFLTAKEKGVTIFYPFQDRRSECSSITGVGISASANESYAIGGQFSTSITGGTMTGAAARPSTRVHLAVSGALHAAHWPAVTLAGDIPFMRAVSEMEWWGGGRRAGAGRAWSACARCARAASAAPPALRVHKHHPAYPDIKKLVVAMLLMVPLGAKPKVTDGLSVVVEPLTYEDAVAKYGLQLTFVTKSNKNEQLLAQQVCNDNEFSPERFPLSDIVALDFCPSVRYHDKIAVATHTGLIFVINI